MRHLSDDELAKYFDDEKTPDAPEGGWSLDDAFANPKAGAVSEPAPAPVTPVPLKRPALSSRPLHPVSRVSKLPPTSDDLTWTGRDVQTVKSVGIGKVPLMLVGGLAFCAVVMVLFAG